MKKWLMLPIISVLILSSAIYFKPVANKPIPDNFELFTIKNTTRIDDISKESSQLYRYNKITGQTDFLDNKSGGWVTISETHLVTLPKEQ